MDEKDFDAAMDMFASDGWKNFIEGVTDLESTLTQTAPDGALTNDQWQYARGQIHQLRSIIGYENYIKVVRDEHNVDPV